MEEKEEEETQRFKRRCLVTEVRTSVLSCAATMIPQTCNMHAHFMPLNGVGGLVRKCPVTVGWVVVSMSTVTKYTHFVGLLYRPIFFFFPFFLKKKTIFPRFSYLLSFSPSLPSPFPKNQQP